MEIRDVPTLTPLTEPTIPRTPAGFDVGGYSPNARHFGFYKFGVLIWETDTLLRNPTHRLLWAKPGTRSSVPGGLDRRGHGACDRARCFPGRHRDRGQRSAIVEPQLQEYRLRSAAGRTGDGPDDRDLGRDRLSRVRRIGTAIGLGQWQSARALGPRSGGSDREATPASPARPGRWPRKPPDWPLLVGVAWWPGLAKNPRSASGRRPPGLARLPISQGFVYYDPVALSKDGSQVVAAGNEGIQIWDLAGSSGPVQVPSPSSGTARG